MFPLWVSRAISPRGASLSPTRFNRSFRFIIPEVFGPMSRIRFFRAASTNRFSRALPSEPTSPNPPAMMTAPQTPFFPQSSRMDGIVLAGVVISAMSTAPSMAETDP